MKKLLVLGAALSIAAAVHADVTTKPVPVDSEGWPEAWFEIFKLAPGKQEAFIRSIARTDEVLAAGGQPPLQMFVHQDGADWDVLLFKPVIKEQPTAKQEAAMAAKRKELNVESGPAYFVSIRENIASHTDSKTYGPVVAADWLKRLDAWRAAHPDAIGEPPARTKQ